MKQKTSGLHIGKHRENRTFSNSLTGNILPSALTFCALAGLLLTATGLTAILTLFAFFRFFSSSCCLISK